MSDYLNVVNSLSQGNPGALKAIYELTLIDPNGLCVLELAAMDLKGHEIYIFYNDFCSRDATVFKEYLLENPDFIKKYLGARV